MQYVRKLGATLCKSYGRKCNLIMHNTDRIIKKMCLYNKQNPINFGSIGLLIHVAHVIVTYVCMYQDIKNLTEPNH